MTNTVIDLAPVKDEPDLFRDTGTNAILAGDDAYYAHKRKMKHLNKITNIENRINTLETKLDAVLSLLQEKQ